MGRPRTIDDRKILEAARDVFLADAAATTADVAKRARISQASIFKRFKSKQALFLAAMQEERDRQDWIGGLKIRSAEIGIKEALIETGVKVVSFMRPLAPLLLTSWAKRLEFGFPKTFASRNSHVAQELVAFIGEEMRAGRLRKHDPVFVTRAFMGALQSYVWMSLMLGKRFPGSELGVEEYVRGIVGVLWNGIAPPKKEGADR